MKFMMSKSFGYAAFLVVLCAWLFRWDVFPVHRGEGAVAAYVVDRITGSVYFLHGPNKIEVKIEK